MGFFNRTVRDARRGLPNLKEPITFHEPMNRRSRNPLDRGNPDAVGGDVAWNDRTGFYGGYLAPWAREVLKNDQLVQENAAAVILNYEPLMDRVGIDWELTVIGRRHRITGVPVPYMETNRYVRINIELVGKS